MTIVTTASSTTQQGDGSNTVWNFDFIIPASGDEVVTLTLIADGTTIVLDPSVYTVSGFNDPVGGTVTYPISGMPLASTYNITIQRLVPEIQTTNLVNQGGYYPDVVESSLDYLTMITQQLQTQLDNALQFPIGASATTVDVLIADILNGAANATAAAASAAAAAASAASVLALLPIDTSNIAAKAVTEPKIANNAIVARTLDQSVVPLVTMVNGTLVEAHATTAAIFSVKTLAGDDPSSTDPVYFVFRDVVSGTGGYTVSSQTSAMSITISSGSTLGFTNNVAARIWLTVFRDGSTNRLGVINTRSNASIYKLSAWGIASSTAEGGAGAADSAQVFYTGTAVSSKAYAVIGYMGWNSGLATAGSWDTSPSRIQLYGGGVPLPGTVIAQVRTDSGAVATGTTVVPFDDTIPQIAEGDQFITQAITPSATPNILRIEAKVCLSAGASSLHVIAALFQDATNSALIAAAQYIVSGTASFIDLNYDLLAGTTSSTTFRIRAGGESAVTTTFNGVGGARKLGGVMNSYIKVSEIMA